MKKLLTILPFLILGTCSWSQQLGQVTFTSGSSLLYFSFITDQGVLIRVSPDGTLLEWGMEVKAERYNYYAPQLQPYMGRVEYYGPEADSISRGKLRSIGTATFTYYSAYEADSKPGKIRSIGTAILDYYSSYENKDLQGKLKFAGNLMLEYYGSTDDEAFRGKLKSVGNTPIRYFSVFDDKVNRGKIKSIGAVIYTWYSSLEPRTELRGALKSGNQRQSVGGVTYILW